MSDLSQLPSIDHLLQSPKIQSIVQDYGRPLSLEALRTVLGEIREAAMRQTSNVRFELRFGEPAKS